MTPEHQDRFDAIVESAIQELPEVFAARLDEVSIIVLDAPTETMVEQLLVEGLMQSADEASELCGLHSGVPLTERSVEDGGLEAVPDQIHLFREAIVDEAGGWDEPESVDREIRITLLHELGHHFGLDEDDLDRLGYG